MSRQDEIQRLEQEWAASPRWKGVTRNYGAEDVVRLRGTVLIEHTLARLGAEKLWCRVGIDLYAADGEVLEREVVAFS